MSSHAPAAAPSRGYFLGCHSCGSPVPVRSSAPALAPVCGVCAAEGFVSQADEHAAFLRARRARLARIRANRAARS